MTPSKTVPGATFPQAGPSSRLAARATAEIAMKTATGRCRRSPEGVGCAAWNECFRNQRTTMPASLVGSYRAMARNNAWANHRLLTACAELTQEEFEAARTGFFPSIKATLNHILIVDWFYVDGLEGGWLGPKAWADRTPCATVAELQREQAAVDRRLIDVCEALTEGSLSGTVRLNR